MCTVAPQVVAPKKAALAEAEGELQMQMNTLNAKRAQLQGVLGKLQVTEIIILMKFILFYSSGAEILKCLGPTPLYTH